MKKNMKKVDKFAILLRPRIENLGRADLVDLAPTGKSSLGQIPAVVLALGFASDSLSDTSKE